MTDRATGVRGQRGNEPGVGRRRGVPVRGSRSGSLEQPVAAVREIVGALRGTPVETRAPVFELGITTTEARRFSDV